MFFSKDPRLVALPQSAARLYTSAASPQVGGRDFCFCFVACFCFAICVFLGACLVMHDLVISCPSVHQELELIPIILYCQEPHRPDMLDF